MKVDITTLRADDLPAADAIAAAAYGRGSRLAELRRYLALRPEGWLLAVLDGAPAGIAGVTSYDTFAYIGLMAVHPDFQRRGVARRLMQRLLADLDADGCPAVLLDASAMGEPLYRSLGFVEDDRAVLYARRDDAAPPSSPARPAPHSIARPRRDDLPAVVAFDTPRFGADRGDVLAAYLRDDPERAFICRDSSGVITGYLIAQRSALGPWVAETPEAASALLDAALALPFDGAPTVIAPAANPHAAALLERRDFAPQRALAHMRRGGRPMPARRTRLYGQASFAIG